MSGLALKSRENRQQKPPIASNTSTIPRRSVCLGSTTANTAKPSKSIPTLRRSVPAKPTITINKTPDLLHPPKFGGQQWSNRKPDITNNLPNKSVQKPTVQQIAEIPKLDL